LKIISVAVAIAFSVTSICYGIDFSRKSNLRAPVGKSDVDQRLIKVIEVLKEGTRNLTNEDIAIAIQILQIEETKPTIKEVARLLKISVKDLLLAEKRGDVQGLNDLLVKDGFWARFQVLPMCFFLLGVLIGCLPTVFTILILPHELAHVFIHTLEVPNEIFDKLVINPNSDPFGIIQRLFAFVVTDVKVPSDRVAIQLYTELTQPVLPFQIPMKIGIILDNFVPSIISATLGWLLMSIGYKKQKQQLLRNLIAGMGLSQLIYIGLIYPVGVVSGWFFGDYIGGVGFILQSLNINVGVDIPFPVFHLLILISGGCVLLVGYLIAKGLISLIKAGISKTTTAAAYLSEVAKNLTSIRASSASL